MPSSWSVHSPAVCCRRACNKNCSRFFRLPVQVHYYSTPMYQFCTFFRACAVPKSLACRALRLDPLANAPGSTFVVVIRSTINPWWGRPDDLGLALEACRLLKSLSFCEILPVELSRGLRISTWSEAKLLTRLGPNGWTTRVREPLVGLRAHASSWD